MKGKRMLLLVIITLGMMCAGLGFSIAHFFGHQEVPERFPYHNMIEKNEQPPVVNFEVVETGKAVDELPIFDYKGWRYRAFDVTVMGHDHYESRLVVRAYPVDENGERILLDRSKK